MIALEEKSLAPVRCIHQLFEERAAAQPKALAVGFEGERLTYGELDAAANRIARDLHALGATTETLVALCVERGAAMVAAILGILKAGAAYVPLDPQYPEERLRFMLSDARAPIVVTTRALAARLPIFAGPERRTVYLLDEHASSEAGPAGGLRSAPPQVDVRPENAAYVIYTSGSTGTPKGVVIEHRQVVRLFQATAQEFAFGPSDVWTLFHSFGFDFSVWELWGALLHGGRVVIVPGATARAPGALLDLLARERVTVLNQTPSAFQQLARSEGLMNPPPKLALRYVIFGGEALDPQTLRGWVDRRGDSAPALINMYGITETTVHVTYRRITRDDTARAGVSPIGRPLRDLFVRLLDPSGKPVSKGQPGEVYVGGAGVARGYLHRPELTAERFMFDSAVPGVRLYRSGDLATELPDGQLCYVGRADSQLKIRGYRIEPGEIESCLRQHAALSSVVVAARDLGEGDMDLVAYVVPLPATPSGLIDELRALAARQLPDYMRPGAYVLLDEIPLNANGKVERMLLPAPERAAFVSAPAKRVPTSPIERTLAEIWRGVLGVPEVGLDDDFFELGGTSLGAVKVLLSVKERLGVSLDMSLWADVSTVAGFAGACSVLSNTRPASLEATA